MVPGDGIAACQNQVSARGSLMAEKNLAVHLPGGKVEQSWLLQAEHNDGGVPAMSYLEGVTGRSLLEVQV